MKKTIIQYAQPETARIRRTVMADVLALLFVGFCVACTVGGMAVIKAALYG